MKEDIDKAIAALVQLGIPKPKPERMTRKEQARCGVGGGRGGRGVHGEYRGLPL